MTIDTPSLLPCRMCGVELRVGLHSAFHPENGCYMGLPDNHEIDEAYYEEWNRPTPPAASSPAVEVGKLVERAHAWIKEAKEEGNDASQLAAGDLCLQGVSLVNDLLSALPSAPSGEAAELARKEGYAFGVNAALALVKHRIANPIDCEKLSGQDPETGAYECALEVQGGNCLCYERTEEQEAIETAITALISARPAVPAEAGLVDDLNLIANTFESLMTKGAPWSRAECGFSFAIKTIRNVAALLAAPQATVPFQSRVNDWMPACFGPKITADGNERNHRFLEESLELVQACGCTRSEAHQLVDYTFDRPIGERAQEVGGVMVTLAALCIAHGLDMQADGETEPARVWTCVEKIRAKQAAKPKHSPLPTKPTPTAELRALVERLLAFCDPTNWDADCKGGGHYNAWKEATDQVHEIVSEYQSSPAAVRGE